MHGGLPNNLGYPTPGYHSGYPPQDSPGYPPASAQVQPHNPGTFMGPSAPAAAAAIAAATGSAVPTKSVADVVASTLGQSSSAYPGIEGSYAKTKVSTPLRPLPLNRTKYWLSRLIYAYVQICQKS